MGSSVQQRCGCGSGSGADLNPISVSGIWDKFLPDPVSLTHIYESLVTICWVGNSLLSFVKFMATKRSDNTLCSFVIYVFGSEIRDPGWKTSGLGSRIRNTGSIRTDRTGKVIVYQDPLGSASCLCRFSDMF
jgi:hypothetical protein